MTFMNGAGITVFTTSLARLTPIPTMPIGASSSLTSAGSYVRSIPKCYVVVKLWIAVTYLRIPLLSTSASTSFYF